MNNSTELQQTLLELHYGLLDEAAAAQWRERIATDADIARAWADVLKLSGQFAEAARVTNPKRERGRTLHETLDSDHHADRHSESRSPADMVQNEADPARVGACALAHASGYVRWPRVIGVSVATVAMLFVAAVIGTRFVERAPGRLIVPVRLQVESVTDAGRLRPNQFRVVTRRGAKKVDAVPASLSFEVRAAGAILHRVTSLTGKDGQTTFAVPSGLQLPKGAELHVAAASSEFGDQATATVPLEPTRCLTYLSIDRSLYRPGETIYFRSLTLERHSLRGELDLPIHFELRDPSGAIVPNSVREGVTQRGVGNGSFTLPTSVNGGEYTLIARSLDGFFPEEKRTLQVQQYRVPRFKKVLEFKRRSHGPGDVVDVDFSALRAEGGPLAGAKLRVTATVDGHEVAKQDAATNETGACVISFKLPDHIADGDGKLAVSIDDGGTQETLVKTIPIQLGKVGVEFYPEGGHLVAGLENRVYFTARNPLGKPIHVAGQILDRQGHEVAKVETVRDGLGCFRFTPSLGERYLLKVTQPVDVTNAPELPPPVSGLPVLDTGRGVFASSEALSLIVRSESAMPVVVEAACRGLAVGSVKLNLHRGENSLSLPIGANASGVIRLTVSDASSTPPRPLVERLVFRRDEKQVRVRVIGPDTNQPERASVRLEPSQTGASALRLMDSTAIATSVARSPGDPLRLTLQATDENNRPIAAVLGVAVVDDAALSLDETERPTLRTHFLLTSEVRKPEDLEHANFYLGDKPEAAESLDLLLGTQGWRRFVERNISLPNPDFREQLTKLLELDGRAAQRVEFDNLSSIETCVQAHDAKWSAAWTRLFADLRIIAVPILTAWLFSILLRQRDRRCSTAGLCLWLSAGLSAGILAGCSGNSQMDRESAAGAPAASSSQADRKANTKIFAEAATPIAANSKLMDVERTAAEESSESGQFSDAKDTSQSSSKSGPVLYHQSVIDQAEDSSSKNGKPFGNTGASKEDVVRFSRLLSAVDVRRLLQARGLNAQSLNAGLIEELRFPVREYAHRHVRRESGLREDFAETLYWQPLLITDADGKATIRFDLSDSVTTFRVLADAHTGDGRIGSGGGDVISRLPFQLEPKLPLEVTTGDRIDLPVAVINQTEQRQSVKLDLSADGLFEPLDRKQHTLELEPGARSREYFPLKVTHGSAESDAFLEVRGVSQMANDPGLSALTDAVRRKLHVAPAGFPIRESLAGVIDGTTKVKLKIPSDAVPGSLSVTLRAFPSPLADLMAGVESILREPHGCFEQTSATNYPNTMALQYLQQNQLANPAVTRKAKEFLDRGYQKLTSFECKQLGYEWFGTDPGHEALSAFGLMQFHDMADVMPVDPEMVARTQKWLLSRRNGQGGFQRNPRHLHVWSVQQEVVDAYVLWALTECSPLSPRAGAAAIANKSHDPLSPTAGYTQAITDLKPELDRLTTVANSSRDPYFLALSAAALMNAGQVDSARVANGERFLETLIPLQAADGSLTGATTVTQSGGLSLKAETTSLAIIAWLKSSQPRFADPAARAAKWIVSHRQGPGGFGSTQATILALKAMTAYSRTGSVARRGGSLQVVRGSETLAQTTLPSGSESGTTIELTGIGSKLVAGDTDLELRAPAFGRLPFVIDVAYHSPSPPSDPNCPLRLTTKLNAKVAAAVTQTPATQNDKTGARSNGVGLESPAYELAAGDTTRLEALLKNATDRGLPMTVAILGLPAGLEPKAEELNELRDAGAFDFYELRAREVILYWRTIAPQAEHQLSLTLTATIPGEYTSPASRTYLYYTAEQKQWTEPIRVRIAR